MSHVPRVYLPGRLAHGAVTIDGEAGRHLATVLRVRPGDPVLLFPGDGREWSATVAGVTKAGVVAEVGELTRQEAPPAVVLETWCALVRANRFEWALEKCAEAAALRAAFPEELGNEYCADEVGHVRGGAGTMIDAKPAVKSLEDLSERYGKLDTEGAILTKEGAMELAAVTAGQESHGEPHAESSAAPAADDHFTRAAAAFEAAKTLDDVQAVWDSLKGVELPAEQDFRLDELGRHATERIKAAKKK